MEREAFMREAIAEAEKARGRTHPNPIVGAIVVREGKIVGRGHHEKAGAPHAEVMALREAGEAARGAALYVTLEPCNHTGRTPPCTDAILAAGIARVFVGSLDPNRHVRGGGADRLRAAGLDVELGVAGSFCDAMNEPWFKFIKTGTPWVLLKAAVTLDGKLATKSFDSRWVSGARSRARVHQLRDQLDAVLVGIHTALRDDPRLSTRFDQDGLDAAGAGARDGAPEDRIVRTPRDPVRVVVDAAARLPIGARMLTQGSAAKTLLAVTRRAPPDQLRALELAGAQPLLCASGADGQVELRDLLQQLAGLGITSLLVEGGASIHGSFLQQQLWDELQLFVAPKLAGSDALSWAGFAGPESMAAALGVEMRVDAASCAPDLLITARPKR